MPFWAAPLVVIIAVLEGEAERGDAKERGKRRRLSREIGRAKEVFARARRGIEGVGGRSKKRDRPDQVKTKITRGCLWKKSQSECRAIGFGAADRRSPLPLFPIAFSAG